MKIAYDHNVFCWQPFGGISRYFCEVAQRISAQPAHDVRVVAPFFVNRYLAAVRPPVRVIGRYTPRLNTTWRANRLANRLASHVLLRALRPRILHETYYSHFNCAPRGARHVVTVFDMIHELFPGEYGPGDRTSFAKRKVVERADHVICISAQTRADLIERWHVEPAKLSVIHLAASLDHVADAKLPESFTGKPYLLYVGARTGYKNFRRFIEAFASSGRLRTDFRIVAFGSGGFTHDELELIRRLRLTGDQVSQISGSDSVLRALYENAAAFVYPSLYEGFGIPPLEAMSFGCPVLCSSAGSIPEVVGDAAQLFDPTSHESIATAIEGVVYDSARRSALVALGHLRRAGFSWDVCARETLDVYERVACQ
jgi:glycosyltransferase involved in cell wall biosynthesis